MTGSQEARSPIARRIAATSVGSLLGATIGLVLLLAVIGIGLALLANGRLTHDRNLLLNQVGPARRAALSLEVALVNEETGIRGYVITADRRSLSPYHLGQQEAKNAYEVLIAQQQAVGPALADELAAVRGKGEAWQRQVVFPALANPRQVARRATGPDLDGKQQFDALRLALGNLRQVLEARDTQVRNALQDAADRLQLLLIVAGLLILAGLLAAGYLLRRTISQPLTHLGAQARRVTGGEFSTPLTATEGPREIVQVGVEIDTMRQRIVEELAMVERARAQLEEQALELTRSNAELEQFAYVASHDLQEPLRKITSFCQALKTRYEGQLDERAEQYIDFAVDGAKRMQVLINDLLTFSRVGRGGRQEEPVELGDVVAAAEAALSGSLERVGGEVSAGRLPLVRGDRPQLISLFQNLISNALKFRGSEPPRIRIEAQQRGEQWELSCSDNGIGIDAEYAERIFLIFQRLHSRESYDGSGIGLALCRKIVEYHGGHIWLDSGYANGARFRFTLPGAAASEPAAQRGLVEETAVEGTATEETAMEGER